MGTNGSTAGVLPSPASTTPWDRDHRDREARAAAPRAGFDDQAYGAAPVQHEQRRSAKRKNQAASSAAGPLRTSRIQGPSTPACERECMPCKRSPGSRYFTLSGAPHALTSRRRARRPGPARRIGILAANFSCRPERDSRRDDDGREFHGAGLRNTGLSIDGAHPVTPHGAPMGQSGEQSGACGE